MAGDLSRIRPAFRHLPGPDLLAAVGAPVVTAGLTLLFVIPTLAPGVLSWDTAEFQTVAPVFGTGHPTGYPSYVILGWLASIVLLPFGDPAYRMNLLQAILAAVAVAGTVGVVQILTSRRLIALAIGLLLACSQLFWRLSTHADYHMLHVALVAVLFVTLLIWERRIHSDDPETVRHADRWLVAAAGIYGVAVANHALAWLLPPAIGLFVLASDWRVFMRPRTLVLVTAVLAVTVVGLYAELPIRAAMNAPLVYGHPDTWSGFLFVVLGQQFPTVSNPFGDLGSKAGQAIDLLSGWLGPMGFLALLGIGTSLIRRPRYMLLSGLAVVATCWFNAMYFYSNADIYRYYLVPLLVAYTWIGLGATDLLFLAGWLADEARGLWAAGATKSAEVPGPLVEGAKPDVESLGLATGLTSRPRSDGEGWVGWAILAGEVAIAAAIVFSTVGVIPERQLLESSGRQGAVSEADRTGDSAWMRAVLAPADQGGLPKNSVIMSWWSVSTTLWYGQKVLGLRPDVLIVADATRKNDHIGAAGEVWDVFDLYLGSRPVFTDRLEGGCDGIQKLSTAFDLRPTALSGIYQVVGRLEPRVSLPACDPVQS